MTQHPRRPALALVHSVAGWLLVAAIAIQVFLAGAAMANLGGSGDFSLHIEFGHIVVGLAALAVVVTAVAAGVPRRDTVLAFGLLVLYFVQTALPALRDVLPLLAALHAANALLLFAAALWYARRASSGLGRAVAR